MIIKRTIGLYVVLDKNLLQKIDPERTVRVLLNAGVRWIQYRDKHSPDGEVTAVIERLLPHARRAGARLILNDRVEIAAACGVDGVHVGQEDTPVKRAKKLLGTDRIVGCSVHDTMEARNAETAGADYLGFGAVYPTLTKDDTRVRGVKGLIEVCRSVRVPVVAIGGIHRGTIATVARTGAAGAAVASALLTAPDMAEEVKKLQAEWNRHAAKRE